MYVNKINTCGFVDRTVILQPSMLNYSNEGILSHLAAKAEVIWRTVQCSPFMGFFVRTPQGAFTMSI